MPKRSPKELLKAGRAAIEKQKERANSQKLQVPSHYHPPKDHVENETSDKREPDLPKVINGKIRDDGEAGELGEPPGDETIGKV